MQRDLAAGREAVVVGRLQAGLVVGEAGRLHQVVQAEEGREAPAGLGRGSLVQRQTVAARRVEGERAVREGGAARTGEGAVQAGQEGCGREGCAGPGAPSTDG